MIVWHRHKLVMLHVPRTGGTAFYQAIQCHNLDAELHIASGSETHMPASVAAERWPTYSQLCVMRSPWEIVQSIYGLFQHYVQLPHVPPQLRHGFEEVQRLAGLSFTQFTEETCRLSSFCPPGGFTRRFTCQLTERVYQYGDAPYDKICRRVGWQPLVARRVNGGHGKPTWSDAAIRHIAEHYGEDIAVYGYKPPAVE